jgi:C4-dicarboxylate transporter DctM subunit
MEFLNGPIIMAIVFVFTMIIGVPIPFAAGIATVSGLIIADIPLSLMALSAWTAFEPFPLVTIPLFILAGQLMEHGGMSEKLVTISKKLVGAYKGGMGLGNCSCLYVFCCIIRIWSGNNCSNRLNYNSCNEKRRVMTQDLLVELRLLQGALGSMIPPSNLIIIFALVSDVSIPRLFLAGIVPGIVLGLMLMVVVFRNIFKK